MTNIFLLSEEEIPSNGSKVIKLQYYVRTMKYEQQQATGWGLQVDYIGWN